MREQHKKVGIYRQKLNIESVVQRAAECKVLAIAVYNRG